MLKPISTRLLRPIMRGQYLGQALCCLVCDAKVRVEAGQAVGWYRDYAPNLSAPDSMEFICSNCAMLEDLDPDWPDNQVALAWVPVRRKMPIQIRESLAELFTERSTGKAAGETPPGMLWVSLPVGCGFDLYNHVRPSQALIDVMAGMLYGAARSSSTVRVEDRIVDFGLGRDYYIDISWRDDHALIQVKYQQILGHRYVAIVPRQLVNDFFQAAKPL